MKFDQARVNGGSNYDSNYEFEWVRKTTRECLEWVELISMNPSGATSKATSNHPSINLEAWLKLLYQREVSL